MLNSISQFKSWQSSVPVDYKKAVETFERDLEQMKGLDQDRVAWSSTQGDLDPRKGEVEVPGVGSLHSTVSGFHLKTDQKGSDYRNLGAYNRQDGGSRDYQVDGKNGTITVTNNVGGTFAVNAWGVRSEGSYQEQYVLDTVQGTIADYAKRPSEAPGNLGTYLPQGQLAGLLGVPSSCLPGVKQLNGNLLAR